MIRSFKPEVPAMTAILQDEQACANLRAAVIQQHPLFATGSDIERCEREQADCAEYLAGDGDGAAREGLAPGGMAGVSNRAIAAFLTDGGEARPRSPGILTGATMFSGIQAPETAMPWINWRWCAEIDSFPCSVICLHHPTLPNLGDVNAEDFAKRAKAYGPIDLLVAGAPCQDFSVAGQRAGMDGARGSG